MLRFPVFAAPLAFLASGASAADLPTYDAYAQPAVTAPLGDWSGPYVGLQLGWAFGDGDASFDNGAPSLNYDMDGFVFGAHAGYNMQFNTLVAGVEGDIEWSGIDGADGSAAGITSAGSAETNWQGSIRGRIGAAFDRALVYTTGGAAIADVDVDGGPLGGPFSDFSETTWGWTVGTGVEVAVGGNLTTRLEYRYTDFGDVEGSVAPAFPATEETVDISNHAIRAGLTYGF
jgi:outer membrane immunogenic protein